MKCYCGKQRFNTSEMELQASGLSVILSLVPRGCDGRCRVFQRSLIGKNHVQYKTSYLRNS